jgi:hypothetical protein
MIDEPSETAEACKCEAQIADILARLEKLEREALTTEKLASLEPAQIGDIVARDVLNGGSLPGHIERAIKKRG